MSLFDLTANTNVRKLMVLNPEFPKDVTMTVIKGNTASASFSVDISEHGKPAEYSYQWYVNDIPVAGATGSSFEKTGLTETETSTVYCDVTNKKGTVRSRTATLKVTQYYLPVLNSSYPQNVTVEKGNSVTCKVAIATAGNPNSYKYQWYKNGSAVSGATGSTYTFTPDIGNTTVYCKVTNTAGTEVSRTATISAIYSLIPGNAFNSLIVNNADKVVTKNSDGSWNFWAGWRSYYVVPIDVTKFKSMTIIGSYTSFKGFVRAGLFSDKVGNLIAGFNDGWGDHGGTINNTYDISNVTGTVYVGVCGSQNHEEKQYLNVNLSSFVFKG